MLKKVFTLSFRLASPSIPQLKGLPTLPLCVFCVFGGVACTDEEPRSGKQWTERELGEKLFFDQNLSQRRTQSCATCHDPDAAFADARRDEGGRIRAGSLGDDGLSVGDRNAPTAMYASFIPPLVQRDRRRFNTDGEVAEYEGFLGGLFHDGRVDDLADQAGKPPLNPIEMGMESKAAVVERLQEDPEYEEAFSVLYEVDVSSDPRRVYRKMTEAIAAFENSETFAPFDSRYDRSLFSPGSEGRYVYVPGSPAALGKALFFSKEFTNCSACHQLHAQSGASADRELFTGYEYHNLGIPRNEALRELTEVEEDGGLGAVLGNGKEEGKFKTPTLRNVAVTAPYMHNGIFSELATVIRFYEHRKQVSRDNDDDSENPETAAPWGDPEVKRNVSDRELAGGSKDLSLDENVLALECFLLTLTDARYEVLLDAERLRRCGI